MGGLSEVLANMGKVNRDARAGTIEGLQIAARNVLNVSNTQVPFEEGDLSRDGGMSLDEAGLRISISYGRSADTKDYAVVQHEDMSLRHDAGRNAKYLENALNSTREQSLQIIGAAIKRSMGT
jgi:hypothetical protein